LDTKEKADSYNERAKNQIRTKALQKGVSAIDEDYKAELKALKERNKQLRDELKALKAEYGMK